MESSNTWTVSRDIVGCGYFNSIFLLVKRGVMKIPKRFKLFAQTIEVVLNKEFFVENDNYGFASYRTNQIQINPDKCKDNQVLGQTFLHELVHHIIYHSGEAYKGDKDHMHQEEGFIDLTASLLHQALETMEYE